MAKFIRNVKSVLAREEGATMVEYGLMVALIAIVAIGGAADIGTALNTLFTTISTNL
jgi:pilus assembly protein Flp/PilA